MDVTFTGAVPPPERPPTNRAAPGSIGRYRILGELGSGGIGVVYRGFDPSLKRSVAVKVLLAGRFCGPDLRARFKTEAEVVARLDHPNIVRVYEVGEEDGAPYLALEFVDGPTLAHALAPSPMESVAGADLTEALARAVGHAHTHGVVHRDLKPANVLLAGTDSAPVPKVTDFGLAKDVGRAGSTLAGEVLGTPSYMAPEQTAGDPDVVGPAADVWALGAILYECLTGRPPFRAVTAIETFDLVRTADPVPPRRLRPSVPRDLEVICLTCLEKDPARRYPSARALADDLARFRAGQPILARPVGLAVRGLKWVRRHPARAAVVAAVVLGTAGGVAGVSWHNFCLQKAFDDLTVKQYEVAREMDRADKNYRQARQTIDRILGRFRDRDLSTIPRLRDLQRNQAEDALAFFERIAGQTGETPEVRYGVARALAETGRLHIFFGHGVEGDRDLRGSADRLRKLASEFPSDPRYPIDLAQALNTLGGSWVSADPLKACDPLTEALALREAARAAEPDSPDREADLAATHGNLGNAMRKLGRSDDAERHYLAAAAHQERSANADPAHRLGLAKTLVCLSGMYQLRSARADDAARTHDRAETVLEQLTRDDPNDDDALLTLAVLRINWAYVLIARGDHDRALADLGKNVRDLDPVLRREPDHFGVRDGLYRTHGATANVLDSRTRWADAAAAWRKCVEYGPPASRPVNRLMLAMALARSGDHAGAVAEVEAVLPTIPADAGAELFTHAATVARLARVNAAAAEAERYAVLAIDCLARAKAVAGSRKWSELRKEFLADSAWWTLLARPDSRAKLGLPDDR